MFYRKIRQKWRDKSFEMIGSLSTMVWRCSKHPSMRVGLHTCGWAFALVSALSLALGGCRQVTKVRRYEFVVRVTSDPDRPVPGASILHGETSLGRTDDLGTARIAVQGNEGGEMLLTLKCPDKFVAASGGVRVKLRKLADPHRIPEYAASCSPTERTVVIAVRADGTDLPILYLGQELARTDESGAAHVLLSAATN